MNLTKNEFSLYFPKAEANDVKNRLHLFYDEYQKEALALDISSLPKEGLRQWYFDRKQQLRDALFSHTSDGYGALFIHFLIEHNIIEDIFSYYLNHFMQNEEHLFHSIAQLSKYVDCSFLKNEKTDLKISLNMFTKIIDEVQSYPLVSNPHWRQTLHYLPIFYSDPSQDSIDAYQAFILKYKPLCSYEGFPANDSSFETFIKINSYISQIYIAHKHQDETLFLAVKEQNPFLFKESFSYALYKASSNSLPTNFNFALANANPYFLENQFLSLYTESNKEDKECLREHVNNRNNNKTNGDQTINVEDLFAYLDTVLAKLDSIDQYEALSLDLPSQLDKSKKIKL